MRILFCVAAAICLSLFRLLWKKLGGWEASWLWGWTARRCLDGSPPHSLLRIRIGAASCGARRRGPKASPVTQVLLDDLGDDARAHGAATLTDGETQALVHRDRLDQLDL